jgi:outer membrane protein assembly factor BamB
MTVSPPSRFSAPGVAIQGWKVVIPGSRPLATPAVVDGRVFVGGGFGSHEFYAFDAQSGQELWMYHTHDDGPTAAIVEADLVAFNTESCELEVLSPEGRPVWKKWLGDPLMSIPAAGDGRIFMVYPDTRGDRRHYLACFHLRTGEDVWKQPLTGEVITTPVLADDHVYLTTLDGTLYCFRQSDGEPVWHEAKDATSSPVVWKKQCYFSRRMEVSLAQAGRAATLYQTESLSSRGSDPAGKSHDYESTRAKADYLDYRKRKRSSPREHAHETHDAFVGFAFAKGNAKMEQAMANLGSGTVAGVWSYQGSKPFVYRDHLYNSMGETLQCVEPNTEELCWKQTVHHNEHTTSASGEAELLDHVLTPPALANGKAFLGTTFGEVVCLDAATGSLLWKVNIGEPIVFQPAVAAGRVFVSTSVGSLYGLETGDPADDGWLMWGANAAHNGLES